MIERMRWMAHHQNHPWPAWAIRAMYDGEKRRLYLAFSELEGVMFESLLLEDVWKGCLAQFSGAVPLFRSHFATRDAPLSKTVADPGELQILDFVVWKHRHYTIVRLYTETIWLLPLDHETDASVYNDIKVAPRGKVKRPAQPPKCVLCDDFACTRLYPCKHVPLCDGCALTQKKCPVCRQQVDCVRQVVSPYEAFCSACDQLGSWDACCPALRACLAPCNPQGVATFEEELEAGALEFFAGHEANFSPVGKRWYHRGASKIAGRSLKDCELLLPHIELSNGLTSLVADFTLPPPSACSLLAHQLWQRSPHREVPANLCFSYRAKKDREGRVSRDTSFPLRRGRELTRTAQHSSPSRSRSRERVLEDPRRSSTRHSRRSQRRLPSSSSPRRPPS